MKTILDEASAASESTRNCVNQIFFHYGRIYDMQMQDNRALSGIKTEEFFGLKVNGYEAIIGCTETIELSLKHISFYLFNHFESQFKVKPETNKVHRISTWDFKSEREIFFIGILGSCWMLRNAVITLCHLFKVDNKEQVIDLIDNSEIIQSRNKIASHNANYSDRETKTKDYYHIKWIEKETFSFHSTLKHDVKELNTKNELEKFTTIVRDATVLILKAVNEKINSGNIVTVVE